MLHTSGRPGLLDPCRSWPRRCRGCGASITVSSSARARRIGGGQGGISRQRKIRHPSVGLGPAREHHGRDRPAQRDPARQPGAADASRHHLSQHAEQTRSSPSRKRRRTAATSSWSRSIWTTAIRNPAQIDVPFWRYTPEPGALAVTDLIGGGEERWTDRKSVRQPSPGPSLWHLALEPHGMNDMSTSLAAPPPLPPMEDVLWYKDAIIYQLHIKSFFDANNDGVGDFRGFDGQARLHRRTRRHRDLDAAVLSVPAAR